MPETEPQPVRTKPTWQATMPTLRGVVIWWIGFYAVGSAAIVALIAYGGWSPVSLRWLIGLNVLAVPLWVMMPWAIMRDKRRWRRIEAAGWRACLRCGYDLTGLGDAGVCPECGEQFEVGASERVWRKAMRRTLGKTPQAHSSGSKS